MEHRHGLRMPSPDLSAVYHYHFHYIVDQNQSKEKLLSKVASDEALRKMKGKHQDCDKQSTSSHQSWKRLINPSFQTQQTYKVRSFKSASPTPKTLNSKLQVDTLKLNSLNIGEKKGYMTPKPLTKRDRATTNTTLKNRQQEMQDLRENSFGESTEHIPTINPENLYKSNFSKRTPFSSSRYVQQKKQFFESQSTKISAKQQSFAQQQSKQPERPSDYAYSLLDQQCRYLRRTFLKHYIKNHLLKQEPEK